MGKLSSSFNRMVSREKLTVRVFVSSTFGPGEWTKFSEPSPRRVGSGARPMKQKHPVSLLYVRGNEGLREGLSRLFS